MFMYVLGGNYGGLLKSQGVLLGHIKICEALSLIRK